MNGKQRNVVVISLVIIFLALVTHLLLYFSRAGKDQVKFENGLLNQDQAEEETTQPVEDGEEEKKSGKIETKVVARDLDIPWSMDFVSDNKMIFTERVGRVNLLNLNSGKIATVLELDVSGSGESGLLGVTLDPEFNKNSYVYLYYSYNRDGNIIDRVSRFELKSNRLMGEQIILDGIPGAIYHDGGRIKFGPDGLLYITTGDATVPELAQNRDSLAGKILRVKKDGSVPDNNPFDNEVYTYGHRNPQGIDWNPRNARLYASEHGPTRMDEINIINIGTNYGWPNYQCLNLVGLPLDKQKNPLACYEDFTLAPSGIAWYSQTELYVAGLRGEQIRKLIFDSDLRTVISQEKVFSKYGRIRDIVKHNDKLYFATNNTDGRGDPRARDDRIVEVSF